jgi:hypothetical protein
MVDKIIEIMSGIKELELEQHRLRNALEMMNRAYDAKKEWVGLTDEDIGMVSDEFLEGALWAEAKLKEKNG